MIARQHNLCHADRLEARLLQIRALIISLILVVLILILLVIANVDRVLT